MVDNEAKLMNWLSQDLINEIQQDSPQSKDIDSETGKVDKEALEAVCSKLFTVNRQFFNFYQTKQYVDMFGEPWGMCVTQESDRIFCCFGLPKKQKRKSPLSPSSQRRTTKRNKSIDCHWEIKFSKVLTKKTKTTCILKENMHQ